MMQSSARVYDDSCCDVSKLDVAVSRTADQIAERFFGRAAVSRDQDSLYLLDDRSRRQRRSCRPSARRMASSDHGWLAMLPSLTSRFRTTGGRSP